MTRGSFGVNNAKFSEDATPMSATSLVDCATPEPNGGATSIDFIIIPSGVTNAAVGAAANANVLPGGLLNTATVATGAIGEDIFCGRFLAATGAGASAAADGSVCSRVTPFKL